MSGYLKIPFEPYILWGKRYIALIGMVDVVYFFVGINDI
jgi:hypothetical protein